MRHAPVSVPAPIRSRRRPRSPSRIFCAPIGNLPTPITWASGLASKAAAPLRLEAIKIYHSETPLDPKVLAQTAGLICIGVHEQDELA